MEWKCLNTHLYLQGICMTALLLSRASEGGISMFLRSWHRADSGRCDHLRPEPDKFLPFTDSSQRTQTLMSAPARWISPTGPSCFGDLSSTRKCRHLGCRETFKWYRTGIFGSSTVPRWGIARAKQGKHALFPYEHHYKYWGAPHSYFLNPKPTNTELYGRQIALACKARLLRSGPGFVAHLVI